MKPLTPIPRGPLPTRDAAVRKVLAEAIRLHSAGRLDEALKLVQTDKAALKTSVGQNIVGDILLKQGKPREALAAFDVAIRLAPSAAEAHVNRGVALEAMGKPAEALAAHDRALGARPDYATAHFNRGNALSSLGRLDEAVAAYDRALRGEPKLAEAHLNRGLAMISLGRPREALDDLARALAFRSKYVAAHVGRAAAYRDLGAYAEAFAALDAATLIEPDNFDTALARVDTLISAERAADAVSVADALVTRYPDVVRAHIARANALGKLHRHEEALAATDRAIGAEPDLAAGHAARGVALVQLGKLSEALDALDAVRRRGASPREFLHARAVALLVLGEPDEARAAFAEALAIDPDNPVAHVNLAYLELGTGNWKAGWAEHEWRLKVRTHVANEFAKLAPPWQGETLADKRLLIYGEQGLGDTIQFGRYASLLAALGAAITLSVPEALQPLFATSFPGIDVIGKVGARSGFDFQVSLMSLPHLFGTTPETVPAEVPYLAADAERVASWRERIGDDGFRVGIVWQGNRKYNADHERSIPLAAFAPLAAVPGVRLISLQAGSGTEQLDQSPAGMSVERLGDAIESNPDGFSEVAAVMANLDLLVMSDTGPTHLAGALGRPVWLALSKRPDWRWMRERVDTPWYPTMRLFRQTVAGDWGEVFERMAGRLAAEIARR